ncbi:hypothetical protein [Methylobacterium currus]|nr:hypothetical protein [Methylobacterium currus]
MIPDDTTWIYGRGAKAVDEKGTCRDRQVPLKKATLKEIEGAH